MVVLKVYDFTGNGDAIPITLEDDRCYCIHNSNGEDQLTFELQRKSDDYVYISEEVLIEGFGNRFIVKKVEEQSDFVVVTCNLDFSDWLDTIYVNFRKTNVTLPQSIQFILPSGWTVSYGEGVDITNHTTIEYQTGVAFRATNAKTILGAISEAFGVVFNYDMLANELKVININSYLPSGDYFIEDLNMSNLKFTGNSSDIVTKLYVYGKKNEQTGEYLTIASVNDGKEYLEDYTYTDRVIVDSVVDERYTVPQSLKEYGQSVLLEKCMPSRSYSFDVSNTDGTIYLYKVVTIVDSRRKLRINHQCVKYIEYKNHSFDKITLSSVAPSIDGMINNVSSGQANTSTKIQEIDNVIQSMEGLIIGTGGNFKWVLNNDGNKSEFLILVDSSSVGTATKLFKLNNTGLYYSSSGYDGPYITIINQNGQVIGAAIPYSGLEAKPTIEGVTIDGNQTFSDWGLEGLSNDDIDSAIGSMPLQAALKYLDNIGVNHFYGVIKQYVDSVVLNGTILTTIDYTATTVTNANVVPWGAFVGIDISQDITDYGTPISIIPEALEYSNPVSAIMVGSNLNVYSSTAVANIPVKVTFRKETAAQGGGGENG